MKPREMTLKYICYFLFDSPVPLHLIASAVTYFKVCPMRKQTGCVLPPQLFDQCKSAI